MTNCEGEGPICPYCFRASVEQRENPKTFDIYEHATRCKKAAQRYLKKREIEPVEEPTNA